MRQAFKFLKGDPGGKWFILAPTRAIRPDVAKGALPTCPLCPGRENLTPKEVYRVGRGKENAPGWQIRVIPNKFPFAPVCELIVHSPAHTESFFTYESSYIAKIFQVYKERYCYWQKAGQVLIFYNHGVAAGESLPHSHTQLAVIPRKIRFESPKAADPENIIHKSHYFTLFIPSASGWPYEVWFLPQARGRFFSEIEAEEIKDLAQVFRQTLRRLQRVLGTNFPFNFYVYHGKDWYLRVIPRIKVPGGFELGTGIFINTVDPNQAARELAWPR